MKRANFFEHFRCQKTPRPSVPVTSMPCSAKPREGRQVSTSRTSAASSPPRAGLTQQNVDGQLVGLKEKLGDCPLRLMIVGHNPSDHAWKTGHYYSNPTNRMWKILSETGIAPCSVKCAADDDLMLDEGVGFTDVGSGKPGTKSSEFKSGDFADWREDFFRRLSSHVQRANQSIGCRCGECGAPVAVAFSGKRHFLELLNVGRKGKSKTTTVEYGAQDQLPDGWPLPPWTEVWVCSSTSGAAVMTNEQRLEPYQNLANRMANVPLIRRPTCRPTSE